MNKATKLNVSIIGSIFGLSGINHGLFEILQGNFKTPGMFIMAIGEKQKMWLHGNEPAFTIIPNFLLSGIFSVIIGLLIIIWSVKYVQNKHGSFILFGLFITLLLIGGGVAQVLFFPWICIMASKINKVVKDKSKIKEYFFLNKISKAWPIFLTLSSCLLVFALLTATFGLLPSMINPYHIMLIMVTTLIVDIFCLLLTFISGYYRDLTAVN